MNQNGTPTNYTYPPVAQQPQMRPMPQPPVQPVNGAPQQYQAPTPVKPAPKKKRVKAKIIVVLILVLLLALIIGGAVLFFTSPAYSVRKDMKNEEYTDALETYEADVEDSFIQELLLKWVLKSYDTTIIENFKNEKIDYESAQTALLALTEMEFEQAEDKLEEIGILQSERIAFETGEKYATSSDYENAIKEFSKIKEGSEQFEDAQKELDKLYPQYAVFVVEQVENYITTKEYDKALNFINTAYAILPEGEYTEGLDQVKTTCQASYQTYVANQITQLLSEEEYEEALSVINTAIGVYDNEDFQTSKTTIIDKYVESVSNKIEKYLKKEDYVTAKRVADNAVAVLPGNSALVALQGKVERATPTYLLDEHSPYSSSEYTPYVNGELMHMGGKSYTNGFTLDDYNAGNAVFNIEGLYETLRFTVGHIDNSAKNSAVIKIYCDGVLEKEIRMNAEDLPRKVTVDVTGVKQLKFEGSIGYMNGTYGFANVTVK